MAHDPWEDIGVAQKNWYPRALRTIPCPLGPVPKIFEKKGAPYPIPSKHPGYVLKARLIHIGYQ